MQKNQQLFRSKKIATRINKYLNSWLEEKDRLIIGIEGYSASGKTAVADCLAEENSAVVVIHLDDLLKSSEERATMMNSGEDRSEVFELKWYRYDLLDDIIEKFKQEIRYSIDIYDYDLKKMISKEYNLSKTILVIEGIFLFHPKHKISKMFDKKIYLDIDLKKADDRRIRREKKRWGKKYVDEKHPNSFLKYFKEAYQRYSDNYHPKKLADLVVVV